MQAAPSTGQRYSVTCSLFLIVLFGMFLSNCKKTEEPSIFEELSRKNPHKPPPPPPPPPPFYFSNCTSPTYAATFVKGVAVNTTISKNYINSPGGNYTAFTSNPVNGLTFSTPAGTFNTGSGTVVFTVTGTPVYLGYSSVTLSLGNIIPCTINFSVSNPPATGPTVDPGPTKGSTGVVNFIYRGQSVAYTTVRAGDGKIWLQQNLGSPQVAFHHLDESSFGDYFQFGRWDDGHQIPNSSTVTGGPSLLNPSHISAGNPNFIKGGTTATKWWGVGGLATDSWSGTTATTTNGKDPCTALGPGWRMPTAADWNTVKSYEDLEGVMAAFMSSLKLTGSGYRLYYDGFVYRNGDNGNYWSSTAVNNYAMALNYDDNTYRAEVIATERGQGFTCRCVKD